MDACQWVGVAEYEGLGRRRAVRSPRSPGELKHAQWPLLLKVGSVEDLPGHGSPGPGKRPCLVGGEQSCAV